MPVLLLRFCVREEWWCLGGERETGQGSVDPAIRRESKPKQQGRVGLVRVLAWLLPCHALEGTKKSSHLAGR